jgi:hypothetical protein
MNSRDPLDGCLIPRNTTRRMFTGLYGSEMQTSKLLYDLRHVGKRRLRYKEASEGGIDCIYRVNQTAQWSAEDKLTRRERASGDCFQSSETSANVIVMRSGLSSSSSRLNETSQTLQIYSGHWTVYANEWWCGDLLMTTKVADFVHPNQCSFINKHESVNKASIHM